MKIDNKVNQYYESLEWKNYFKFFFRRNKKKFIQVFSKNISANNFFLLNSGRAGILLSLIGLGINRNENVFVSSFLNSCVLSPVNMVAYSSNQFNSNTKVVLLNHQWGYSQNFEEISKVLANKDIKIIEDCAHGYWGKNFGVNMGDFGDTSIYSPSKLFKMTYCGGIKINNLSIYSDIKERLEYETSLDEILQSFLGEIIYVNYYSKNFKNRSKKKNQLKLTKWYQSLLTYPRATTIAGNFPQNDEEMSKYFKTHNKRFLKMLDISKNFKFILQKDDLSSMGPLCFPYISDDDEKMTFINNFLKTLGIHTGFYNFDLNRNMFSTNYTKCIPIPLYTSINEAIFEKDI